MAASPQFKVYSPNNEYVASFKYLEDAACLVSFYGNDARIVWAHGPTLWHEGHEEQPASESYDFVAQKCLLVKGQHGGSSYTPKL